MSEESFVPEDFAVPDGLIDAEFRLLPLGPQHNEADYTAWTASIDHIRATPGFGGRSWPHQMPLDDNLRDLERHAQDFAARRGFTYTVLSTDTGDVIGCVYIYPPRGQGPGGSAGNLRHASVRSWVRADRAALDSVLHDAVLAWLERAWPFHSIEYAPRTLPVPPRARRDQIGLICGLCPISSPAPATEQIRRFRACWSRIVPEGHSVLSLPSRGPDRSARGRFGPRLPRPGGPAARRP
jgi:hypothetical protein